MKLLIKVTADHLYIDPSNAQVIQAFRPTVVENSNYIAQLLAAGKVRLISNEVKDEATDEEFEKFLKDSDKKEQLAIDAFMSKFSSAPKEVKDPKAKA